MATVLVVEPDRIMAALTATLLNRDYRTVTAVTVPEAENVVSQGPVDLVLIRFDRDLKQFVDVLTSQASRPRIVVTGFHLGAHEREELPEGIDDVMVGVASAEDFADQVDRLFKRE